VRILLELYRAAAVKREDMIARTTIAKMVAFLFVQILSVRVQHLRNVQVLLLGTR
jgi:hypothetical protein